MWSNKHKIVKFGAIDNLVLSPSRQCNTVLEKENQCTRPKVKIQELHWDCDNMHFRKISSSNCRVKSTLYFLQRSPLCFHNISSYVQDSKKTDSCKSQIHWADSKLGHNTQEIKANDEVGNLMGLKNHRIHNQRRGKYTKYYNIGNKVSQSNNYIT